ncbi:MAG: relaxase domain-containing protein [Chromatiales bacterium]|nr:relaxase domain-containing protein [Chromatiales bacterium]
MVVSIGAISSAAQGVSYFERDGYYAKEDPGHLEASAWTGKGAEALGLRGTVDPNVFREVLEGSVPDGSGRRLGWKEKDGAITHRPGRDLTFSAPKSVSLAALLGNDAAVAAAHDEAVRRTLAWLEATTVQTRMKDADTGLLVHAGNQNMVAATFRHEVSRNLDPQLHTHAVLANMVQGDDGKWRTMSNETLYRRQKLIGMVYRSELAQGLEAVGYRIEKTHADGRFEIAGVPRGVIEAFSTRRAEIEAAMEGFGLGDTGSSPHLAERAALMTRARKRDIDREALRGTWREQAASLGFSAESVIDEARERRELGAEFPDRAVGADHRPGAAGSRHAERGREDGIPHEAQPASRALSWAIAHLSEREAVFARSDLMAATLAWKPGAVSVEAAGNAIDAACRDGRLHAVPAHRGGPLHLGGEGMTTDTALADERETIGLMRTGQDRGQILMRLRKVQQHLHKGPLTDGQKQAVTTILSSKDRVVGVQGYAGTGKTAMLDRARALAEKNGYRMTGLAPSASAVQTLAAESGIASETLQGFLARNAGVAEGRFTRKSARNMRDAFAKTVLVVDEGSLASTVQARNLLRIANTLRIPRVVLVGDEKQLDAVDAGKPFAQLQQAGMQTAVMDEIMRQREPALKEAVEASIEGDIRTAFEKLGSHVAEVKADNIAGAVAARWLKLSPEEREKTGVMAPSHELRVAVNGHIRERLAREGAIHGPAFQGERLVSCGYTRAEKALAANYAPGDVVAFHRPYRRLRVEKGDERRVVEVDRRSSTVILEDRDGGTVAWKPAQMGGRHGGSEVYRAEPIELREGDRVRWTRNDKGLGLVNSRAAEVVSASGDRVSFRLEDGRELDMGKNDTQLRHLDHAWASTVHAFQGRTVDNVIAAMEANHPHLTTRKSFYVEISRARYRAELVTDDALRLRERLEATTGERISALEAIAPGQRDVPEREAGIDDRAPGRTMPERPDPPAVMPEADRSDAADKQVEREHDDGSPTERRPAEPAPRKRLDLELELEL